MVLDSGVKRVGGKEKCETWRKRLPLIFLT